MLFGSVKGIADGGLDRLHLRQPADGPPLVWEMETDASDAPPAARVDNLLNSEHHLGELAGPMPALYLPITERRFRMKNYVLPSVAIASLGAVAFLFTPQRDLQAHCQVPCGIYNDHGRIDAMLEDVTTITKAIAQINELSQQHNAISFNQATRWVSTKEEHASHIITTVAEYFLTQKVKAVPASDTGYQAYLQSLALHHHVMRAAMKTKQTVDPKSAAALREAVEELGKLYPKK